MGGGDLNMKKSWHPALLVNQDKVWQAEKKAAEERKALRQLQKERDEERQLAELQRLQEAQTGKKRVEKLDWMYAAPSTSEGAMGGGRTERELEDYLLGKKRVDEALRGADKDVGNTSKDFIALQNANTARDTAAKIREDPMFAMEKAKAAHLAALANRPDVRRALKAKQESKEDRRERRRAEKEERRRDRHERRRDYSDDDRDRERRHRRDDRDDRRRDRDRYDDDRDRDRNRRHRDRDRSDRRRDDRDDRDDRDRKRSRSLSPRRDDRERKRRDSRSDSPRRDRDRTPVKRERDISPKREPRSSRDHREPSPVKRERDITPKREPRSPRESRNGSDVRDFRNGHENDDARPRDRRDHRDRNGAPRDFSNGSDHRNGNGRSYDRPPPPRRPSPERKPAGNALDDMRAARLAAMSGAASQMYAERSTKLAQRAEEEKRVFEAEERARAKYHRDEAAGMFMKHQEQLGGSVGLAESLQRRGGKGLLRDI
ncbi:hypothetical protein CC85DRAFT_308795 [Cutaneotrichosporon oleaginosum]|uniref:CBF1-interacting co-repressor CIR N-terminal domain-containing protein n=1 Tax=Cutaneotrichosporon oleaginosum TaxID=879819 RepID=A0A0J0XII0_9TREE|nr:uncharacterized protein CC85DRAFT_308795 [Cutaneotrichosporon oleaginosum]KLT40857.1 hypothetical protein CC85DRAFT_308795 [Cutaneotrichosporon oleaginosum]TXT09283.1 hypothetical protein COLE_03217 [Cutaneotrichosporon oleaginosum]